MTKLLVMQAGLQGSLGNSYHYNISTGDFELLAENMLGATLPRGWYPTITTPFEDALDLYRFNGAMLIPVDCTLIQAWIQFGESWEVTSGDNALGETVGGWQAGAAEVALDIFVQGFFSPPPTVPAPGGAWFELSDGSLATVVGAPVPATDEDPSYQPNPSDSGDHRRAGRPHIFTLRTPSDFNLTGQLWRLRPGDSISIHHSTVLGSGLTPTISPHPSNFAHVGRDINLTVVAAQASG